MTDQDPLAPHDPDDVSAERRRLLSLAYRMTGTMGDAEDVVQETYLRWYRLDPGERAAVRVPAAWLTRVAGRVALDHLGSARVRREAHVGQWLPEPVPADLFAGTAPVATGTSRLESTAAPAPTIKRAMSPFAPKAVNCQILRGVAGSGSTG